MPRLTFLGNHKECLEQLPLNDRILLLVTNEMPGPILQLCPITTGPVSAHYTTRVSVPHIKSTAVNAHWSWLLCYHRCWSWPCVLVHSATRTEYYRLVFSLQDLECGYFPLSFWGCMVTRPTILGGTLTVLSDVLSILQVLYAWIPLVSILIEAFLLDRACVPDSVLFEDGSLLEDSSCQATNMLRNT